MRSLICLLVALSLCDTALAARCTGSANCKACKTCAKCAHCQRDGNTCGVCKPKSDKPTESTATAVPAVAVDGIRLYFAPGPACTTAIVRELDAATSDIRVQAYRLTSKPIAKSLVAAHERGVRVQIVLDGVSQSDKYSDATYFHNHGLAILIDAAHPIAHNKLILIDGATVITGSYNFSESAESNAENLLIISGKPELFAAYRMNFDAHAEHSREYVAPAEATAQK